METGRTFQEKPPLTIYRISPNGEEQIQNAYSAGLLYSYNMKLQHYYYCMQEKHPRNSLHDIKLI